MIDIYNLPLYYISFEKNSKLEEDIREQGFTNINHFKAIDGRQMNVEKLREQKLVTIRAFNDIKTQRVEHAGISSLGAIGCALSHYELWKKCVENDMEHIIILEEDVYFPKKFTENDIKFIDETLQKPKSCFFSTTIKYSKDLIEMCLLHFCIMSKDACKELIKHMFPIDVQVDHYISHIATLGIINIGAKPIAYQKNHISSIQDFCIKCILPNSSYFYIKVLFLFLIIIGISVTLYAYLQKCYSECKKDI